MCLASRFPTTTATAERARARAHTAINITITMPACEHGTSMRMFAFRVWDPMQAIAVRAGVLFFFFTLFWIFVRHTLALCLTVATVTFCCGSARLCSGHTNTIRLIRFALFVCECESFGCAFVASAFERVRVNGPAKMFWNNVALDVVVNVAREYGRGEQLYAIWIYLLPFIHFLLPITLHSPTAARTILISRLKKKIRLQTETSATIVNRLNTVFQMDRVWLSYRPFHIHRCFACHSAGILYFSVASNHTTFFELLCWVFQLIPFWASGSTPA